MYLDYFDKFLNQRPYLSIDEAVDTLCEWRGLKRIPKIPLWSWLVKVLIKILPIQLSPWDHFSIKQRHFIHAPITNPEGFVAIDRVSGGAVKLVDRMEFSFNNFTAIKAWDK